MSINKIIPLGKVHGRPYEVVVDSHDKHIQDMAEAALEKMLTSHKDEVEFYHGPFRIRVKPVRKMAKHYAG